ncbi:ABC transporter substrate-binding protein [Mucilaginibacter sp. L196]|uniref:ABC transporter substrate-binding protein n=1 Tax=Mucilaginibacter sp. L196 TaxID=1641870 RepID=UPI00131BBF6B|nr:ABC transporter substrate-binding protein [Mucilaginibacter sp. L196]
MAKIKVGVFVPYSGIYRNLRSDFLNGIDAAIPEALKKDILFQPEFIQTGSTKQVEDAFRKLVLFESVDLLTGIVSTSILANLIQSINTEKIPCIINNLGGYMPIERLSSPYLFYNSMHLWKSEWAIGKWMQNKFGGIPAIGSHIYDSGYNMHECFRIGTVASGADECRLHILKLEGLQGFADTAPLIEIFKYEEPSHAHIILSSKEGTEFINKFYSDAIADKIPISVSPFMVNDDDIFDFNKSPEIINALSWDYNINNSENVRFKNDYEQAFGTKPNVFGLLGYETGLAITQAIDKLNNGRPDKNKLTEALSQTDMNGPRGKIAISTIDLNTPQPIYIRSAKIDGNNRQIKNEVIDVVNGIEWNDKTLASVRHGNHSWQNPYLCV